MKVIVIKYRKWKLEHPATEFTIRDFVDSLDRYEVFMVFEYLDEQDRYLSQQKAIMNIANGIGGD